MQATFIPQREPDRVLRHLVNSHVSDSARHVWWYPACLSGPFDLTAAPAADEGRIDDAGQAELVMA